MKLSEILEQVAVDHLDDRTEMLDGEPDVLWPAKTIVRYLNEAQRILARRAWVLQDIGHPQAGVLTLVTDKPTYKLHPSVLRVYYAQVEGAAAPLPCASDSMLLGYLPPDLSYFDVNQASARTPGAPRAFASDAAMRTARVYPTPSAAENGTRLLMKVARLPVCWLDAAKPDECPEVPEEWHDALAIYAAGRCLQHNNIDATAKTEGVRLVSEFNARVLEARQERERAEYSGDRPRFASSTAVL